MTGQSFVPATYEKQYALAVLAQLKCAARDSTYGKTFSNLSDLIPHVEPRFAPHKTYSWYVREITTNKMLQNGRVSEFCDRLMLLKSRPQAALENKYESVNQMILSLNECASEAFIRGLPGRMPAKIELRDPMTLQKAFRYAIDYGARHQTDRLFFKYLSRYQQPNYRDWEEKSLSPEERAIPKGLNSTNPAQDPDERLSDFNSLRFASNFDQQQQHTLNMKFNPYQNFPVHQNYNHHHSDNTSDYRLDYWHEWKLHCTHQKDPETSKKMKQRQISVKILRQREKSSMPKSTDFTNINAFTIYDSAKESRSICSKSIWESDPSIHSEISPNCSSENLSEVTGKIN